MFKLRFLNIYDAWLTKKDFIAFKDSPVDMKILDLLKKRLRKELKLWIIVYLAWQLSPDNVRTDHRITYTALWEVLRSKIEPGNPSGQLSVSSLRFLNQATYAACFHTGFIASDFQVLVRKLILGLTYGQDFQIFLLLILLSMPLTVLLVAQLAHLSLTN